MTTNVLIASWTTTVALALLLWRAHCRLVLVARASHELRGPLCAAQLGLSVLAGEPARVAAIDLELRRAGRALEDLAAARSGARGSSAGEALDLVEWVEAHTPTWRTLAAAHGATLTIELPAAAPVVLASPAAVGGIAAAAPGWPAALLSPAPVGGIAAAALGPPAALLSPAPVG